MYAFARAAIMAGGVLLFLGGLGTLAIGGNGAILAAAWLLVPGGFLIALPLYERARYHAPADQPDAGAAPGGGIRPGSLEPRFQRTGEVFVDPTSRRRMRVYMDEHSGERRYVTED